MDTTPSIKRHQTSQNQRRLNVHATDYPDQKLLPPRKTRGVMPKAYAVITYQSISDSEKHTAYSKLAVPAVTPFGAHILAFDNAVVALEYGLKERTVVVEYPSVEEAVAAYNCPAYREALKVLGDGAVRDVRVVEGGVKADDISDFEIAVLCDLLNGPGVNLKAHKKAILDQLLEKELVVRLKNDPARVQLSDKAHHLLAERGVGMSGG